jgi:hypothetical protein
VTRLGRSPNWPDRGPEGDSYALLPFVILSGAKNPVGYSLSEGAANLLLDSSLRSESQTR